MTGSALRGIHIPGLLRECGGKGQRDENQPDRDGRDSSPLYPYYSTGSAAGPWALPKVAAQLPSRGPAGWPRAYAAAPEKSSWDVIPPSTQVH